MKSILFTVGNYTEIPSAEHICTHTGKNKIVFVGKMDYDPNVIATTWFVKNILPELNKTYPDLVFQIVGAYPHKKVIKLGENNKNVEVTGRVESIEPYFKGLTIFVAPMLTGAGIQNKIIQAMSYSCCVVTTPTGAEGLDIQNGEIAICSGVDQWIDCVRELLDSPSKRIEMGIKARQYIINHLSAESVEKDFLDFININK